jgi:ABC-type transporter Mla MlaB component
VTILTYQLPALMTLLGSPYFQKLGIRAHAAGSVDDLVDRAAALRPELVIVPAESHETSAAMLARLRAPSERSLVFAAFAARSYARLPRSAPFDGVICLDDPEALLGRTRLPSGLPWTRRDRRTPVRIPVQLPGGEVGAITGETVDLGPGGAQLLLRGVPLHSGPMPVLFHRSEGSRSLTVQARAVWLDARDPRAIRAGVRFLDLTYEMRKTLDDLALWDVAPAPDGESITLHGELSESSLLWPLAARMATVPQLDLGQLGRINFAGIYRLVELLDVLPRRQRLRLLRVPAALIQQPAFDRLIAPRCTVESHYALFDCEPCGLDVQLLVTREREGAAVPCPVCGAPLGSDALTP